MPTDRLLHPRAGKSEKVTMLTDLEYRVWTQYLLSADDFGVMQCAAVKVQADNHHLANRPAKVVQRCLATLTKPDGLLRTFTHQGRLYAFQHDWQTWQKVEYPRATNEPKPPPESLDACDEDTRRLLDLHPGGKGEKFVKRSGIIRKVPSEFSEGASEKSSTNARVRTRESAKANGDRLTALERGPGETDPPMDEWARELVNLAPKEGRCAAGLVERPLFTALYAIPPLTPPQAFEFLKQRLEEHKRSHQWRVKGMVKRLDRWLAEGLYLQELPEVPVSAVVSEKTARNLTSAATFVKGGGGAAE